MDRSRVDALLHSVGQEQHWQVARQILSAHDEMAALADGYRAQVAGLQQEVEQVTAQRDAAKADASRLADHIIRNPSGDYRTVLQLHDRA